MGDLSPHFSKAEFACPCCHQAIVAPRLIIGLEELRDKVGKPIKIHSGYRCPHHNTATAGAAKCSTHMNGEGADISVEGLSQYALYNVAVTIPEFLNGGIGIYPQDGHLHVDCRDAVARWSFFNGIMQQFDKGLVIIRAQDKSC